MIGGLMLYKPHYHVAVLCIQLAKVSSLVAASDLLSSNKTETDSSLSDWPVQTPSSPDWLFETPPLAPVFALANHISRFLFEEAAAQNNISQSDFLGLYAAYFGLVNDESAIVENLKLFNEALYHINTTEKLTPQAVALVRHTCHFLGKYDNSRNVSAGFCPYYFDLITCWHPVPRGTVVQRLCPLYVAWTRKPEYVQISCLTNSAWSYTPLRMSDFCSTYGNCQYETGCDKPPVVRKKQPKTNLPMTVLRYLTIGSYLASFLATTFSLIVFACLKRLRCPRNTIHMHLLAAFWLKSLLTVIQWSWLLDQNSSVRKLNTWDCKALVTLWTYSNLAVFSWMLVEALYLHNIIYFNVFKEPSVRPYVIFGWGSPIPVILTWIFVRIKQDDIKCWAAYDKISNVWIIKGPIMMTFAVNFVLFANITRELFLKVSSGGLSEAEKYRKLFKSTGTLFVLCGLHYLLLAFALAFVDTSTLSTTLITLLYTELIPTSLQGLFVSLIYCLCNSEVQREILRHWFLWRQHREMISRPVSRSTSKLSGSGVKFGPNHIGYRGGWFTHGRLNMMNPSSLNPSNPGYLSDGSDGALLIHRGFGVTSWSKRTTAMSDISATTGYSDLDDDQSVCSAVSSVFLEDGINNNSCYGQRHTAVFDSNHGAVKICRKVSKGRFIRRPVRRATIAHIKELDWMSQSQDELPKADY